MSDEDYCSEVPENEFEYRYGGPQAEEDEGTGDAVNFICSRNF